MTTIIAGNFQQQDAAREAWSALERSGIDAAHTARFFVNPQGQHDRSLSVDDMDASPGAHHAGIGAVSGAAIGAAVGFATMPVLGPEAAVAAAGVGAYAGSLVGALGNTDDTNNPEMSTARAELQQRDPLRKSGMLLAIASAKSGEQAEAIRILRAHGATDIERAEGNIVAGEWSDFNPLTPLMLVQA